MQRTTTSSVLVCLFIDARTTHLCRSSSWYWSETLVACAVWAVNSTGGKQQWSSSSMLRMTRHHRVAYLDGFISQAAYLWSRWWSSTDWSCAAAATSSLLTLCVFGFCVKLKSFCPQTVWHFSCCSNGFYHNVARKLVYSIIYMPASLSSTDL